MHISFTCLFVGLFTSTAFCQDPQFSQYYSSPLYLNPAYAGYAEGARVNTIYRNQWRDLGQYTTSSVSADVPYECGKLKMGAGAIIMRDRQSDVIETLTGGVVLVPPIIKTDNYSVRTGLFVGGGHRSYRRDQLTFMDQLSTNGSPNPSADPLASGSLSKNYLDVGIGGIVDFSYSENSKDWIGISIYHFNQPKVNIGNEDYRLPMRISVHMGSQLKMVGWDLTPIANFRMQGSLRQLDVGAYVNHYSPVSTTYSLVWGILYRGIPLSNQNTQDAIIGLVGIQNNSLAINFSYDVTISRLSGFTGNTFECTLSYTNLGWLWGCLDQTDKQRRRNSRNQLRCPK